MRLAGEALILHGRRDVELLKVVVDGATLDSAQYVLTPSTLTIAAAALPNKRGLEIFFFFFWLEGCHVRVVES